MAGIKGKKWGVKPQKKTDELLSKIKDAAIELNMVHEKTGEEVDRKKLWYVIDILGNLLDYYDESEDDYQEGD